MCSEGSVFIGQIVSAGQSEDGFPVVQVPETAHSPKKNHQLNH